MRVSIRKSDKRIIESQSVDHPCLESLMRAEITRLRNEALRLREERLIASAASEEEHESQEYPPDIQDDDLPPIDIAVLMETARRAGLETLANNARSAGLKDDEFDVRIVSDNEFQETMKEQTIQDQKVHKEALAAVPASERVGKALASLGITMAELRAELARTQ